MNEIFHVTTMPEWHAVRRCRVIRRYVILPFVIVCICVAMMCIFIFPPIDIVIGFVLVAVCYPFGRYRKRAMAKALVCIDAGQCPGCLNSQKSQADGPLVHASNCDIAKWLRADKLKAGDLADRG